MNYLEELFAHQQWADAAHWRAFEAHPASLEDKAIRERLVHIHLVQHAFHWMASPRSTPFVPRKVEDFPSTAELKIYAKAGGAALLAMAKAATPEWLEETFDVPWLPGMKISRRHALMQAAMHSHYHRGQNATRLRELGGAPPPTDFIVWIKEGMPDAKWE